MEPVLRCPVCDASLKLEARHYRCESLHTFDIAREGYVNLLLAHHRRSAHAGDSAEMIASRRAFLEAGYYDALRARLAELAARYAGPVLDAGCGEGFYLAGMMTDARYGVDISKAAIRVAARRYTDAVFAVAAVKRLPVHDGVIGCLLSVFAPRTPDEFARVLAPDGAVLVVSPGPDHLWEVRQALYAEPRRHDAERDLGGSLRLIETHTLRYELHLPHETAIAHLLAMTPYIWQAPQVAIDQLLQMQSLSTPVDFVIQVYQRA